MFAVFGHAMNADFSNYNNDLSSSLADSNSINKHLKIFEEMLEMMKKIFNFTGKSKIFFGISIAIILIGIICNVLQRMNKK